MAAPGTVFDLSNFKLTLPVDGPDSGGVADTITQPALDSYSGTYFQLDGSNRLVCTAPVQGATTSGSGGTRSELREMDGPDEAAFTIATSAPRQLTVTGIFNPTSITDRKEMIVGQIHGASGTPPLYLTVDFTATSPRLRVFVNGPGIGDLLTGLTATTTITYRILVSGGRVKLWGAIGQVSNLPTTPQYDWPASTFTDSTGCYLKVGAYNKSTVVDGGTGSAISTISVLDLVHGAPPSGGGSGGTALYPLQYTDGTLYPTIGEGGTVVNVATSAALTSALSAATAGQKIRLASGTYSGTFTIASKTGTSTSGISIEAATTGGAVFASGSKLVIDSCAHVTVRGLSFPFDAAGDTIAIKGTSHHVRITRNLIGPTSRVNTANATDYIYAQDTANFLRIDHNELRFKGSNGNGIRIYGDFTATGGCKYVRIDHNWLHDFGDEVGNGKEAIYCGTSNMSRTIAYSVIERNVLERCQAEPEVISCKMSKLRVSGNTVLTCAGSYSLRHGRGSVLADNYFIDPPPGTTASGGLKSGGYRFYDTDHTVEYNYNQGQIGTSFESALIVDTGDASVDGTDALNAHWQVKRALVRRNVLVNTNTGIRLGDGYTLNPADVTLTDNVAVNTASGQVVTSVNGTVLTGASTNSGNLYYASTSAAGMTLDATSIYRRSAYGPRLTYLSGSDVGVTGDLDDSDGTGRLVGASSLSATVAASATATATVTANAGTPGTGFLYRLTTATASVTATAVPPVVVAARSIAIWLFVPVLQSPGAVAAVTSVSAQVSARAPSPIVGARTVIEPQSGRGRGRQLVFVGVDTFNGMCFPNNGRSILIFRNSSGSAATCTVWFSPRYSAGHTRGRVITIPAGAVNQTTAVFPRGTYSQPDGRTDLDFSTATGITVAVVEGHPRW